MFKQTIKANILTTFLFLLAIIAVALLSSQYYFSQKLAINSTNKTFKLISDNIAKELKKDVDRINSILYVNKSNENLYRQIDFDYNHPALEDLTRMMSINNGIYAMYFTHSNGSFFEVINMNESTLLYDIYKAPQETRWTVIISIDRKMQYIFLDKNNRYISKHSKTKKYNPLTRPWYTDAIASKNSISTKPYLFFNLQRHGITYATQLEQKASVFAIDYTMKRINELLALQKFKENSEVFIFNKSGEKVASSSVETKKVDPPFMNIFFTEQHSNIIKYNHNNNRYFSIYKTLKNKELFLGIKIDATVLLKPYIQNIQYSFAIALLLLLLTIPIIFFATNIIVRPIKALIVENEKIKNRQFDKVANIDTNILEFLELSSSFVSMSNSIQEYQKAQEELLDSIVKLIAEAVDAKSAYTGGHCKRVPEIAQMLLHEANLSQDGVFKDFKLDSQDELREFEIGAWLHDCGKVTTPEYVVDKSTKLETINNRIHEIRTRFEVLWRDAQVDYLSSQLSGKNKDESLKILKQTQEKLVDNFSFIANANIGGEFMSQEKQKRIREIADQEWERNFDDSLGLGELEMMRYDKNSSQKLPAKEKLLSDKKQHIIKREFFNYEAYKEDGFKESIPENLYNYGEIYNLCIEKGTLSPEERYKINEHVILSIKMLEKIPFPSHMTKIPEYAGTHHETLIGTGYPRQLTKEDLSIPARVMAIADIFEALTASDRPYKKAKTLSESIKILSFMVKNQHIDEDLFKLFLRSGLYKTYAEKYLKAQQIDDVDVEQYR